MSKDKLHIDKITHKDRETIRVVLEIANIIDMCGFCVAIRHDSDLSFKRMIVMHFEKHGADFT